MRDLSHNAGARSTGAEGNTAPLMAADSLSAHVLRIRNAIRNLQGLPPLPEETK